MKWLKFHRRIQIREASDARSRVFHCQAFSAFGSGSVSGYPTAQEFESPGWFLVSKVIEIRIPMKRVWFCLPLILVSGVIASFLYARANASKEQQILH
jgi:hypothetical protein